MLGKVKKYFGIEGLKISIELAEEISKQNGVIEGFIVLNSIQAEEVKAIDLKLIEKYARGRGKTKLIDEYKMAEKTLLGPILVEAHIERKIPFSMTYNEHVSEMDMMERKNFIFAGVAKLAKFVKRANSTYRIEAQASVKGTKFNAFSKASFKFI